MRTKGVSASPSTRGWRSRSQTRFWPLPLRGRHPGVPHTAEGVAGLACVFGARRVPGRGLPDRVLGLLGALEHDGAGTADLRVFAAGDSVGDADAVAFANQLGADLDRSRLGRRNMSMVRRVKRNSSVAVGLLEAAGEEAGEDAAMQRVGAPGAAGAGSRDEEVAVTAEEGLVGPKCDASVVSLVVSWAMPY